MGNYKYMNVRELFKRVSYLFRKYAYSPEKWAKYIGVNIGINNLIGKTIGVQNHI